MEINLMQIINLHSLKHFIKKKHSIALRTMIKIQFQAVLSNAEIGIKCVPHLPSPPPHGHTQTVLKKKCHVLEKYTIYKHINILHFRRHLFCISQSALYIFIPLFVSKYSKFVIMDVHLILKFYCPFQ